MGRNSNASSLEETGDIQKEEGSDSVSKLDLNLEVSKDEEGTEVYAPANTAYGDGKEMGSDQQEDQGSPLLLADDSSFAPESLCTRPIPEYQLNSVDETGQLPSLVQTVLGDDHVEVNSDHSRETSQSPFGTGEAEMVDHDNYSGRSSSPLPTKVEKICRGNCSGRSSSPLPTHTEMEAGDSACCLSNLHSTVDTYYHGEEMVRDNHDTNSEKTPPHYGKVREICGKLSKSDFNKEMEGESPVQCIESPLRSGKTSSNYGEVERGISDPNSFARMLKRSASPLRRMSVSSERSPSILISAGHTKISSAKGVQEPYHSPGRRKHSPSRERTDSDRKRVPSHDHSIPLRMKSTAPRGPSRRDSQRRDGSPQKRLSASPGRRYSQPGLQRRDRSSSRSPVRRKDSSSGQKRDNRRRSRSRSPHARDRNRRSPRRYSPRRRSPPHHSRRRSPRRPWSPPPNRSTGVGRPGKNLFVAGFSFVTTERDLERKFSRFGRVTNVRIVRDKRTGDSRGFGFLSLERDEDADAAIRALDQTEWNGRIVLVEKSKTHAP